MFVLYGLIIWTNYTFNLILDTQVEMSRNGPGLYEFLMEAELQQYYPGIRGKFICFRERVNIPCYTFLNNNILRDI